MIEVQRIETTKHDEETGRELGRSVSYQVERNGEPLEGMSRIAELDRVAPGTVRPEWRRE